MKNLLKWASYAAILSAALAILIYFRKCDCK